MLVCPLPFWFNCKIWCNAKRISFFHRRNEEEMRTSWNAQLVCIFLEKKFNPKIVKYINDQRFHLFAFRCVKEVQKKKRTIDPINTKEWKKEAGIYGSFRKFFYLRCIFAFLRVWCKTTKSYTFFGILYNRSAWKWKKYSFLRSLFCFFCFLFCFDTYFLLCIRFMISVSRLFLWSFSSTSSSFAQLNAIKLSKMIFISFAFFLLSTKLMIKNFNIFFFLLHFDSIPVVCRNLMILKSKPKMKPTIWKRTRRQKGAREKGKNCNTSFSWLLVSKISK